jgi:hypothetical protein
MNMEYAVAPVWKQLSKHIEMLREQAKRRAEGIAPKGPMPASIEHNLTVDIDKACELFFGQYDKLMTLYVNLAQQAINRYPGRFDDTAVLTPQAIEAACAVERRECAKIAKAHPGACQTGCETGEEIAAVILARGAK